MRRSAARRMFTGMGRRWFAAGAALAGLAVAAGAFGTHALEARLAPELLGVYETATRYHLVHAIGLMLVGLAARPGRAGRRLWSLAGWAFVAGIVVFAGSLYLLAFTGLRWLGAITPVGGAAFLAGWAAAAAAALRGAGGAPVEAATPEADDQSRGGVTPR